MQANELLAEQTRIVTSLLIAYVIGPSDVLRDKIVDYAAASLKPMDMMGSVNVRIRQCAESNPMLWFRLFRNIRENEYDIRVLGELGILDLQHMSDIRERLQKKVGLCSPFPHATWVMHEQPKDEKKGTSTVLYGDMRSHQYAKKAKPGHRTFSIVRTNGRSADIVFSNTVPAK